MKIGIIGSGGVAQTLGSAFAAKGHNIRLGTRDVGKLAEWLESTGENASAGSFEEAAKFGDVVLIAVKGDVALPAIELAGRDNFKGKTVLDLTNPMDFSGGVPHKFVATVGNSLGEQMQSALPDAHVVKAFNTIGTSIMVDPKFGYDIATMFIAGNDENAKAETAKLIKEFGWDVEDLGGIEQSFFLEAFASLWVNYGFKSNNWSFAFKLLKR